MERKVRLGGQAVIEGVMIRSNNYYAVSIRKNKKIISKTKKIKKRNSKFFKMPVVRGFYNLIDMLKIGMGALMWSVEQTGEEKLSKKEILFTLIFSIVAVILLFIVVPYFTTSLIGFREESSPVMFNVIDGLIRIILFLGYVLAISFMPDIKRIFQYHGAEHMAVHCYENNKKLSIKNIKKYPTMHPRCGTSFLLLVLVISILIFSFVPSIVNFLFPLFIALNKILKKIILFIVRILMIPLIAGISYEILKLSDKYQKNILFRIISMPGIMLQKITTKKPTNAQVEVAINSVKLVAEKEGKS